MGSSERRTRAAESTRVQILEAARRLFVTRGFEETSMRAIARAIEYTPTAIYHHFQSKEALFQELLKMDFQNLALAFRAIGAIDDPVLRIVEAGQAYLRFAETHPMHYRLMFMTPGPSNPIVACERAPTPDPVGDAYAFIQGAVAHAMAGGHFRRGHQDADLVAQLLWGGLHGLVSLHIAKGADPHVSFVPLREACLAMHATLLRGLLSDVNHPELKRLYASCNP